MQLLDFHITTKVGRKPSLGRKCCMLVLAYKTTKSLFHWNDLKSQFSRKELSGSERYTFRWRKYALPLVYFKLFRKKELKQLLICHNKWPKRDLSITICSLFLHKSTKMKHISLLQFFFGKKQTLYLKRHLS